MTPLHYRHPDPAFIFETVVDEIFSDGADLTIITLDEFKARFQRTIRSMVEEFKATKAWPRRCTNFLRSVAV